MSGYCARCGSMICECDVPVKVMNERVAELEQENAELKRHNRDLRDNKLANDEAHYAQVARLVDERDELKCDVQERHDATQENYEVILKLREQIIELERWNANLKTENFKLSQESATILEHCKDLERIIAERQTQKPVAYMTARGAVYKGEHCSANETALFAYKEGV